MLKSLLLLLLVLSVPVFGQEIPSQSTDSLLLLSESNEKVKDTILRINKESFEKKKDSLANNKQSKKEVLADSLKKKRYIPYIKPMEKVTIKDYKMFFTDDTEKSVDTTLSLEGEYTFNFLRKDYFELLPLPNMGEGFNKLGYEFQNTSITPQMGARVKHFGYFEKEDILYYEVPSPYTELFFKTTFEKGQHLDATLAVNTSPKFNIAVSFKGFRSLGKYTSSLSRSRQFRLSTQYQTYNQRYRLRLHQTTQTIENEVNGGLTNDAVYFFENASNYVMADEQGQPILDENGEYQYIFYDGFLDRSRLSTHIKGRNVLEGKRYFMEHRYQLLPVAKDTTAYALALGIRTHFEDKQYQYNQSRTGNYFGKAYVSSKVADTMKYATFENNFFAKYKDRTIGNLQLDVFQQNWNYSFTPKNYDKDSVLNTELNINQLALKAQWEKTIFGTLAKAQLYNALKSDFASKAWSVEFSSPLLKHLQLTAKLQNRSQPLNFNFHLFQSDYITYNWENKDLVNQEITSKSVGISHSKWGSVNAEWNTINHYAFFNNVTSLLYFNKKFTVEVIQLDQPIEYFKARLDQRINFGKFSWANNVQYQTVTQEQTTLENSYPTALNVPKWLIRSTLMLTSDLFNKALFFQSGMTFVFFTDFYADQYNPLLAEFVTQNNTKIGEYPRVDFFFNAKIQSSRVYFKIENLSSRIEHLINPDTLYDYYAAPFVPYRDMSIRFGLIWNFFD